MFMIFGLNNNGSLTIYFNNKKTIYLLEKLAAISQLSQKTNKDFTF